MRPRVPEVLPVPSRVTAAPVTTVCSGPAFAVGQLDWHAAPGAPPVSPPSPLHPLSSRTAIPSIIRLLGRTRNGIWLMGSLLSGTLIWGKHVEDIGKHRMDDSGALRRVGGPGNGPR